MTPQALETAAARPDFGSDTRLYYRLQLANGFELAGRSSLAGTRAECRMSNWKSGGLDTSRVAIANRKSKIANGMGPSVAAELTQSLNPSKGRSFPTGIIASLSVRGEGAEVGGGRIRGLHDNRHSEPSPLGMTRFIFPRTPSWTG